MKTFLYTLLILSSAGFVNGQSNSRELPQAKPEDVSSISAIITALYQSISGDEGAARDWQRFRSLWYSNANLTLVSHGPTGDASQITHTVESFILLNDAHSKGNSFYELEVFQSISQMVDIATAISTYEIKESPNSKEVKVKGVNMFQLYFDGKRWWIMNCIWENESNGVKIPAAYLPKH